MLQVTRQHFQVESGRLLRVMQLEDPDTGAADQQVEVVGAAPPGSTEGDTAENPEDLIKSAPDYYPGQSGDQYGYGNFGGQVAGAMKGIYGAGMPGDQAGGGSRMGLSRGAQEITQGSEQFQNTGLPPTGASQQNPTGTTPGQPGAAPNAAGLTGGPPTADYLRNFTLSNTDDPTTALNTALRQMGVNPFNTGNPFVSFIQRAAPGLAAAFMMQNATGGVTPQSAAQNPGAFGEFLKSSIGGGHAIGGMAGAAGLLPQIIAKIRETGGQNANEVNPFLSAMANILGTGFGEGTTGVLSALLGPSMNRTLAGGYKTGLEKALSNAQYNFPYEDVASGQPNGPDIWKFLLGA